ncbi:MAG: hypothetical protein CMI31_14325 [Opitutae bacterium]|nr:hypothetical protein [Opitutae bacterium]
MNSLSRILPCGLALILSHASLADIVRTTGGSVLNGRIEVIDKGTLKLETPFAGTISIELEKVASFSTDKEAFLRLSDGSEPRGRVEERAGQSLLVEGPVPAVTPKSAVLQLWRAADADPDLIAEKKAAEALRKKWKSSISFDLTGSSGNADDFGLASQFKGVYGNKREQTKFHLSYHKSQKSGETTTDETEAGVEHSSLIGDILSWYVKADLESDKLEEVDLRSTTSAGIKYTLLKRDNQELYTRSGIAFRFEDFNDGTSLDGPAIDFGLEYSYQLNSFLALVSELDYVPSVEDFTDFRITQDTGLEMPISKGGRWKLRLGLANDYNSRPVSGKKHLDLRYYTRLVYSWE